MKKYNYKGLTNHPAVIRRVIGGRNYTFHCSCQGYVRSVEIEGIEDLESNNLFSGFLVDCVENIIEKEIK